MISIPHSLLSLVSTLLLTGFASAVSQGSGWPWSSDSSAVFAALDENAKAALKGEPISTTKPSTVKSESESEKKDSEDSKEKAAMSSEVKPTHDPREHIREILGHGEDSPVERAKARKADPNSPGEKIRNLA